MKSWEYYREPKGIKFYGFNEQKAYKDELIAQINDQPLTADQRTRELATVNRRATDHFKEKNKPYNVAKTALVNEFWVDARAELRYENFLTTEGVAFIELKAYEDGHAHGFGDIYSKLTDLVEFAEKIIQFKK
jgi:hypothetical protein